jgi:predicted nucleotidyltransferase
LKWYTTRLSPDAQSSIGRVMIEGGRGGAMTTREILLAKRDDILRAAAAHGARNVRVFGSVARGDASESSDLDLLVDLEEGRTLFDHAALLLELRDLLGLEVDVVTARGLRARIRERVMAEAIPL